MDLSTPARIRLVMIVMMMFFIPIINPRVLLATEPLPIKNAPLNGEYIGKHLEYLNHQNVIESIINELQLDQDFKEKVRSGNLVSDDTSKVEIKWTSTGYSAFFERSGEKGSGQLFEVGVHDLEKPGVSSEFKKSDSRILKLAPNRRPYWLRLKIINESDHPIDFLLELDKHLYDYINIYIPQKDGFLMKRKTFADPLDQRGIKYRHFVFQLSAEPGEKSFYLFVNSWIKHAEDAVPLRIWSRENYIGHTADDGMIRGLFVGLFLFIFFYNIFIYCSVKDPSYVFLALVTVCQLALEVTVSGLGFQYLWPNNALFSLQVLSQNTALVMGFNLLFYRSFIGTFRYTPRLDKVLLYMSWFFFAVAVSFFLLPRFLSELMLALLFTVDHLYTLPVLIPAVIAIRNKNRSGVFVLIGISFYYLGLLKFSLTGSDILPYHIFKYLPIKGLSFLIIMTLGLSHKFNSMRKSLIDLNINLERRVIERTEKLQQANEKLKELDTFKNRLFANISHEFRTPLTLIIEPIRSLQKGEYGKLSGKSLELISSMKRNADRLLKLISDYLDLSKIEAGRMDVNRRNHNVSELLSVCISSFDSNAVSRGIEIRFQDQTGGGFHAQIDPELMEKAIFNLLSNAIKFNRPDGESKIFVTLEHDADYFRIRVKDSGIRIPSDKLESIFERFHQVDSSLTRRHEGTGIGLSLTMEIVELHKGEIFADSQPDEGSIFVINIPLHTPVDDQAVEQYPHHLTVTELHGDPNEEITEAGQVTAESKGIPEPVSLTKDVTSAEMTILIVEDNDDMRGYLEGILGRCYHTSTAANGKEALQRLEMEEVDLVLSDLMMPEMDGYELTQTIRSHLRYEGLPIILLTARADVPDKIQGFEKGANDYIIKPFSAEEVLSRIKSQLSFKVLRDKLIRNNLNLKGKRKILTDVSMIRIEAVKEFLNDNYAEDFSREDLASMAKMSPDHLGKMFKQYTGVKLSDYINHKRVEEASRQLQETSLKIVDIAFDVGFGSLRSFNQVFREVTGDSPSDYRKKSNAQ